jgi:hypothetical protein
MKKHFHIHIKKHAGIFTKAGKDPYADWLIILTISFIAAIIFIGFSASLFLYINGGGTTLSSDDQQTSVGGTLDRSDLAKLISDFQDKQARTALFQAGYQGAPDPSGAVAGAAASASSTPSPAPVAGHRTVTVKN